MDRIYSARHGFTAGNRQTYLAARIGNTFGPKSVRFRLVLVRARGLFALMCNRGFERYRDIAPVDPMLGRTRRRVKTFSTLYTFPNAVLKNLLRFEGFTENLTLFYCLAAYLRVGSLPTSYSQGPT
jgi:hypothetical protein